MLAELDAVEVVQKKTTVEVRLITKLITLVDLKLTAVPNI